MFLFLTNEVSENESVGQKSPAREPLPKPLSSYFRIEEKC